MPQEFEVIRRAAARAAKVLTDVALEGGTTILVTHLDADGISAAGIMGRVLARMDAPLVIKVAKQLDREFLDKLRIQEADLYLFTDFGSGYLSMVNDALRGRKVVVLDHHQPVGDAGEIVHVNPYEAKFDGVTEVSGAGVSYLVAKEVDGSNVDLAYLAAIGALGDIQDRNEKRELVGLNKLLVEDAVRQGLLEVKRDLIFYGRETRPIHSAIAHTLEPFIPGLSGDESACLNLLLDLRIELKRNGEWRTIADLTIEERRRLFTELVKHIVSKGVPSSLASSLIGGVYTLLHEEKGTVLRDCREFSVLLNACGRMEKAGLGIAICMGCRGALLEEAKEVLGEYRRTLARSMEWALKNIEDRGKFHLLDGREVVPDTVIGALATILSTSTPLREKPIIAIARSNGILKISARASSEHVAKGIDLGKVLREAAGAVAGIGGGHNVAAGAQIPEEGEAEFLSSLERLL